MPDNDIDFDVESENELECTANPLSAHRHAADETLVVNNGNLLELAPGEDKETKHILFDEKRKFGYTLPREHYLTPTNYFHQCFLNYSQKFTSNSDYLFFAQSVLQQEKLSDQINVAIKKVSGRLTAGIFANYEESVKHFISNDEGFLFEN